MAKQDDGGPILGGKRYEQMMMDGETKFAEVTYTSITLRDVAALVVLPWCVAEFGGNSEDQTQPAQAAWQIADAFLAERRKEKP